MSTVQEHNEKSVLYVNHNLQVCHPITHRPYQAALMRRRMCAERCRVVWMYTDDGRIARATKVRFSDAAIVPFALVYSKSRRFCVVLVVTTYNQISGDSALDCAYSSILENGTQSIITGVSARQMKMTLPIRISLF